MAHAEAAAWSVRLVESTTIDNHLVVAATALFADLVRRGAALGWVEPPNQAEVAAILRDVAAAADSGDAALAVAEASGAPADGTHGATGSAAVIGLGYWTRYVRPTHRPHADLARVAVADAWQGHGVGRALTVRLVDQARALGIEQLTLDARGDNAAAFAVYRSLGFVEYGRLADFVAVGNQRYDKTFWVCDLRPG